MQPRLHLHFFSQTWSLWWAILQSKLWYNMDNPLKEAQFWHSSCQDIQALLPCTLFQLENRQLTGVAPQELLEDFAHQLSCH